jgi:hypothetical protein
VPPDLHVLGIAELAVGREVGDAEHRAAALLRRRRDA